MRIRRVTAEWLNYEPFWYELERRGLTVAAIDVPMTFPPRLKLGTEIINWGSHDLLGPFTAHPENLVDEIRRRFGSHPMGYEIPVSKSPNERQRIREALVAGAHRKSDLLQWVLSRQDWDFFLTVYGETHRGGHLLWPLNTEEEEESFRPLLDVYQAVDHGIGNLLTAISNSTPTVVFSLHGMGPNTSQEHFIPEVMDRANSLFATGDVPTDDLATSEDEGNHTRPFEGRPRSFFRRPSRQQSLTRLLREKIPPALQNLIARAVPVTVRDEVVNRQITEGRNWNLTPGLPLLADLNGYLRFNIKGRESRGILDPGGKNLGRYSDWIRECFQGLRVQGTGEPIVREVLLSHTEFPGHRSHYLPDMVVTWTGVRSASAIHSETIGEFHARLATGRGGNHRSDGFCIFVNWDSDRDGRGPVEHIRDLAPFVFRQLLGEQLHTLRF